MVYLHGHLYWIDVESRSLLNTACLVAYMALDSEVGAILWNMSHGLVFMDREADGRVLFTARGESDVTGPIGCCPQILAITDEWVHYRSCSDDQARFRFDTREWEDVRKSIRPE
ncbi:MAG: hypothetical protein ACOYN0_07490 [Phycisphaerales bacterium]